MGIPVVLVHGLRTSRTMWRAQVEALECAGHPALAVDLPGHGARIGEPFTLDGAVRAVLQGVAAAGDRVLLVGLSLGGYVSIAATAREPDGIAGLVAASCSTRPIPLLTGAWGLAARGIARLPDAGAGFNQFLVDRTLPVDGAQDVGAGGFALEATAPVLRELSGAATLADLARIDVPVWLVNGRYDHFRGEERRYLRTCRDGRLIVVPGATHLVSLIAPVAFTRVLLEAAAALDSAGVTPGVATPARRRRSPRGSAPPPHRPRAGRAPAV